MARKPKAAVSRSVRSRAKQALEFARQKAAEGGDWVALHNALFGRGGKATELFPDESERTAFARTAEYKQVLALLDELPAPEAKEFGALLANANGAIRVHVPRAVHAALLAEAKAEGVSLNQLCLAKRVAQFRAVV
jgi:hypothetical protein